MANRDVRPSIDKALHPDMLSLFKSIPSLSPALFPTKRPSHIDSFLRSESPPHTLPKEIFVPIFCRANRMHGQYADSDISMPVPIHASMPSTLRDLPAMLPPVKSVDDGEDDMHKQHMAVVSGWGNAGGSRTCLTTDLVLTYRSIRSSIPFKLGYAFPSIWDQ